MRVTVVLGGLALLSCSAAPTRRTVGPPEPAPIEAPSGPPAVDPAEVSKRSLLGRAVTNRRAEAGTKAKEDALALRQSVNRCFRDAERNKEHLTIEDVDRRGEPCRLQLPDVILAEQWVLDPWAHHDGIDAAMTLTLMVAAIKEAKGAKNDLTDRAIEALDRRTIVEFAWLAGRWEGTVDGVQTEEIWCPTPAGNWVGRNRTIAGGQEVASEQIAIGIEGGAVTYRALPAGAPSPTSFGQSDLGTETSQARFENPEHDFPRTLNYRRVGALLEVSAVGVGDGKRRMLEWTWNREGTAVDVANACAEIRNSGQA